MECAPFIHCSYNEMQYKNYVKYRKIHKMNDKTDTQALMNLFDLGAEPFDAAVCIYTLCKVCNLVADNALYGVFIDVGALCYGDERLAAVVCMMPCVECKTVEDDLELTGI